ncbi:MAG TPA: PD-(D/E)XK nuclease family protein [Planctomycetota bacterium]|nr:PD-(D/E)XK nuclease family protein [Planctomycetota bacterium]
MADLFVRLMRYTGEKEDFLTECLAATLEKDKVFAGNFLTYLYNEKVSKDGIIDIKTQVPFKNSRIDMVIDLKNNKSIGIENKLWSPEGQGYKGKGQLNTYLSLPAISHLAFITGYPTDVPDAVDKNKKYLKPKNGRRHFIWSDFYEILNKSLSNRTATEFNRALHDIFKHFGFEPAIPEIGNLQDPNEKIAKRNRENFAKLWELTRQGLRKRGWKWFKPGSIAELIVAGGRAKRLEWAWLDPTWRTGSLRVRLHCHKKIDLPIIKNELESPRFKFSQEIIPRYVKCIQEGKKALTLEVMIPMKKLFAYAHNTDSMSKQLADFVCAVFDKVG